MTTQTMPAAHRDNLLGVCAALGEDFGFNPLWLRIALAATLIVRPEATLIGYAIAGVLVLASRLLIRRTKRIASATPVPIVATALPVDGYVPERLAA